METFPDLVLVFCMLPFVVFLNFFFKTHMLRNISTLVFSLLFLVWICSKKVVILMLLASVLTQVTAAVISRTESKRLRFRFCLFAVLFVIFLAVFSLDFVFSNVFSNMFFDFERIVFLLVLMADLAYLIDIYKRYGSFQKSFINYLTYVFVFPKLFLGPVLPYYKFSKQIINRTADFEMLSDGIELFIVGFAKKVVFANEFYEIYGFVAAQTFSRLPVLTAWLGAVSGFLSLVFNFSGYSDMAVGVGKMLGYDLPFNVKKVFFVTSVYEFFNQFNCSTLAYFKNYIFPWWGKKPLFFKFLKAMIIAFCMAIFLGDRVDCYVAATYFLIIMFLEKVLINSFLVGIFKNFSKFITLIFLIVGTVLFQSCGIKNNFKYLCAMGGVSGVLIDFSFIFWMMFLKLFIMICVLLIFKILQNCFEKIKFLRFFKRFKCVGLVLLFLVSIMFSLSQI